MWKIVKVNVGTTNQLECLGLTNSSSKGPEDGGGASSTGSICRGSTWQRQCCLQVGKGICNSQRGLWYRSYAHQGARLFCTLHCALLIGPDNTRKRHTSAICFSWKSASIVQEYITVFKQVNFLSACVATLTQKTWILPCPFTGCWNQWHMWTVCPEVGNRCFQIPARKFSIQKEPKVSCEDVRDLKWT